MSRRTTSIVLGSGAPAPVTPLTIFGGTLVLWSEPRLHAVNDGSGRASSMADGSGSGNTLVAPGIATTRPAIIAASLNGQDGIRGDGVDDYLEAAAITTAPPYTVFALISQVTWTINDRIVNTAAAGNGCTLIQVTASPQLVLNNGAANSGAVSPPVGTPMLVSMRMSNSTSDYLRIGHPRTGTTGAGAINTGNVALAGLRIFRAGGASAVYANADLWFIAVVSGSPTNTQLDDLANYLSPIYGAGPVT